MDMVTYNQKEWFDGISLTWSLSFQYLQDQTKESDKINTNNSRANKLLKIPPFGKTLLFAYSVSISSLYSCQRAPFGWAVMCLSSGGEPELVQVHFDYCVSSFVAWQLDPILGNKVYKKISGDRALGNFYFSILNIYMW